MRSLLKSRRFRNFYLAKTAVTAIFLLSGCLGFESDDPSIPEQERIKEIPVYAHAADFTTLSGILFKPFATDPSLGLAFSREKDAPHGGYFYLESSEPLSAYLPGDAVTVQGRLVEDRFAPWQNGRIYEVTRIAKTLPETVDGEYPWPY